MPHSKRLMSDNYNPWLDSNKPLQAYGQPAQKWQRSDSEETCRGTSTGHTRPKYYAILARQVIKGVHTQPPLTAKPTCLSWFSASSSKNSRSSSVGWRKITISCRRDLSALNVQKSMPLMIDSWNVGLCGLPAPSTDGARLVPCISQRTNTCTGSHTPT